MLEDNVVDQICGIPIPDNDQDDYFVWGASSTGEFSVKSTTWLQCENMEPHEFSNLLKKVWKANLAPKIKVFGWLLLEKIKNKK